MSDIFISYKREEQPEARKLADALEQEGWTVWWDPKLRAGDDFDAIIEAALKESKCIIVLWSEKSLTSDYVRAEASEALEQKKLVPVAIENVTLPFRFKRLHTPKLVNWDGSNESVDFRKLVEDITAHIGQPTKRTRGPGSAETERAEFPRLQNEAERKAEQERVREQQDQRVEEQKRREAEDEERKRLEEEKRRAQLLEANQLRAETEPRISQGQRDSEAAQPKPSSSQANATQHVNKQIMYGGLAAVVILFVSAIIWQFGGSSKQPLSLPPAAAPSEDVQTTPGETAPAERTAPAGTAKSPSVVAASKVLRDPLKSGGEGPEMVVIPAGSFQMGDIQRAADERPVHKVTIAKPFAIGRYAVTFDDYGRFAKATGSELPVDSGWGRGRRPVIHVNWQDARKYAEWVSAQTGKRYRLPTEAEWEYAARAGTETAYWWDNNIGNGMANCGGCGSQWDAKQTAPVGSFKPNKFGLYDTAGNVWEWVEDCLHENYKGAPTDGSAWLEAGGGNCGQRVVRGGSWNTRPVYLRSSDRNRNNAGTRNNLIGFRLAQDLN